ncbi:dienelactone hydrolase family protein [Pseudactinotalea suaedae]|uniref:dienelactone hydrolase family protein n=1 Tax=Pseudactinotalea suaedae TaxID=1524924 RepID=UPI0012E2D25C|nr:dienelactone hydrolase family protein [Pseudactinotalea suaedae]
MSSAPGSVIQIEVDDGALPVHVYAPESGSGPGIVLVQEIFGVSPYIAGRAADLAAAGYLVHVPDLYWRLDEPELDESAPDLLQQAMGRMSALPWEHAVADTAAAVRNLRATPEVTGPIGLVGFCYGGGVAFNVAAIEHVDALVSYYGSALPNLLELAPAVTAPSLHHVGEADSYLPTAAVAAIRDAVTRPGVELHTYPGADHAFDNTRPEFHHAEASALAWQRTLAFLDTHLARPAA